MPFWSFVRDNWFSLLQSLGIIASLLFTAVSMRKETASTKVANLMAITQGHREIWGQLYDKPELSRVLNPNADLRHSPVQECEEVFVRSIILHLNSSYQAIRSELISEPQGLVKDVQWFFSLPIPANVWRKIRPFQNTAFVDFVECPR